MHYTQKLNRSSRKGRLAVWMLAALLVSILLVPAAGLDSLAATKNSAKAAATKTTTAATASGKTAGSAQTAAATPVGNTEVIRDLDDLAFLTIPAPSCDITYDLGGGRTFEVGPEMALSLMKTNADGSYYIDQNMNYYVIDSNKVRTFLNALQNLDPVTSDTLTFKTTSGQTKEISSTGYTKRVIDVDKELTYLRGAIMTGAQETHKPATKLAADDYVEVDLTGQKAYYYKDGKRLWSSDIVSGNMSNDHATPEGVYYINNKVKDTKLIGEDYESPVSYWMPFIANSIGLHDATWRWSFGGSIYKTSGSHGCVNLPLKNAATLFDLVSVGTPVIAYY